MGRLVAGGTGPCGTFEQAECRPGRRRIPDDPDWWGGGNASDDGHWSDDPFVQTPVYPTGVVEELDGKEVRLPGFIVPLDLDDVGNIREFFLVPYFGACMHFPPRPPNQIVHVTVEEAFPLYSVWDPFWVEGAMRTEQHSTELGLAGYALQATKIEVYEE